MTSDRSITSSVEVAVDPDTAFKVFTEELACWWRQGPINFFDSTRAFGMRLEPGVGGRLLEVYDDARGEGLELARITVWEPGARLAWASTLDDVATEVSFTPSASGTVVRVEATIPAGGTDEGGTAWVRVTPAWLGSWMARRDLVARAPERLGRLAVAVRYRDPGAAARWLRDVCGLEPAGPVPAPGEPVRHDETWIELRCGDAAVVVLGAEGRDVDTGDAVSPWCFVDDLDAHHARVVAGGGRIVVEPWHHGTRAYSVADPEGSVWTFAQAMPRQRDGSG
jgi:uncharacterized glyoxalase superfamily protein PhnB